MKAYGLPRDDNVENPDVVDIHRYGLKSSAGNFAGKGGDIRSSHKKSSNKRNCNSPRYCIRYPGIN